jgi:hypothetical protein
LYAPAFSFRPRQIGRPENPRARPLLDLIHQNDTLPVDLSLLDVILSGGQKLP